MSRHHFSDLNRYTLALLGRACPPNEYYFYGSQGCIGVMVNNTGLIEIMMNNATLQQSKSTGKADKPKKPFDKKKYRQQKYSNKYKVNKWEDKRKKVLLRNLYTELIKKKQGISVKASNPEDYAKNAATKEQCREPCGKPNSILSARLEYKRRQNEMKRKKEELQKAKAERQEALKKYKERRTETYKKLSRKTKKGQPVMKDRLELLLAKIQNET